MSARGRLEGTLWPAFGNFAFLAGQVIGKGWMVLLSIPVVRLIRERDARLRLQPA
jgi:hypothetical protein